jgi:hypothetical protein
MEEKPESRSDTIYNLLQKYNKKKDDQEIILKDLKHTYSTSKKAIEDKINSATESRKNDKKNNKVESKISHLDAKTVAKIKYYEESLRQNEEKRFQEKKAIDDKCDKYSAYLTAQKELLETQAEILVRDLSNNIIETPLYQEIDESAYPTLTKLKCNIDFEQNKYDELFEECSKLHQEYKDIKDKERKRSLELIEANNKRILQEEENKRLLAVEKAQQARQQDKEAEEARYRARLEKAKEEAEEKEDLTPEELEALEKAKEEQKKEDAKKRAKKVKEFYSQKNRKAKLNNLSQKQEIKFQKLDTFAEKAKFLDALPDPEVEEE